VLWYAIRYGAWASFSWILNGKKVFVGIPELGVLEHLIDLELVCPRKTSTRQYL